MSIRSVWCDIDKETRKYIIKRDKECIICHNKKPLTMAHIFLSRAKGGKGCKENIVALCPNCHYYTLDNPIGKEANEKSKQMMEYCKKYLIEKENIKDINELMKSLKYNKDTDKPKIISKKEIPNIITNRCKNCAMLQKKEVRNSSIPIYYCSLQKKRINKNAEACKEFRRMNNGNNKRNVC